MEQILASESLGGGLSLHIATLSRGTVERAGAAHLGFDGYFVFEAADAPATKGISILGKAASLEAAFRLIDLWAVRQRENA